MTEHSSAQDALNGLHIIAAVTQQAVNYQFAQLHKREILPQRLDLKLADTGLELKAELASPLVYFDLVTDHRSALFVLRMPKGVFSFWDGIGPNAKQKSVEFEDWSYAFTVALDMQALAAAAIAAHVGIPSIVKEHLDKVDGSIFSIRHLFLDFTNADLASYDPNRSRMTWPDRSPVTPGQMTQFQDAIRNYFSSLKNSQHPYILGFAIDVHPSMPPPSAIDPTKSTFCTFHDNSGQGDNTLNFLLMTGHQDFPKGADLPLIDRNLVTSRTFDGRFVIAAKVAWEGWLLRAIGDGLQTGDAAVGQDGSWAFKKVAERKKRGRNETSGGDYEETITDTRQVSLKWKDAGEEVELVLSGFAEHKDLIQYSSYSSWADASVTWSASATLAVGHGGQVTLEVRDLKISEPVVGSSFWSSQAGLLGQHIAKNLRNEIRTIGLGALALRLVMPAGDVFFFKNITKDVAGNLQFDVSYKAEPVTDALTH